MFTAFLILLWLALALGATIADRKITRSAR